jgi:hypothetical protein
MSSKACAQRISPTHLPLQVDCSFTASVSGGIVPGTGSPPTFPEPSAASRFFLNRLVRGSSSCAAARAEGASRLTAAAPLVVGVAFADARAAAAVGFASACLVVSPCFPSVSWALAERGAGSASAGLIYTGPCAAASPTSSPASLAATGTAASAAVAALEPALGLREKGGLVELGSVAFFAVTSAAAGSVGAACLECEAPDLAVPGTDSAVIPSAAEAERADAGAEDSETSPLRALG